MTKYEDVKNETTEHYFNGNQFSIDVFNKKYALHEDETYVGALKRVCDYIASAELTPKLREYWSEKWFDEIYNDWWHPAGSIMQGSANPNKVSLCNCTYCDLPGDSLEAILRYTNYKMAKMAAYRQGLGTNYRNIRPRGMRVKNSSNISQGSVHFMSYLENNARYIGQEGRIPAFLYSQIVSHPDIEEFIKSKIDHTSIQNANISVQATNDFYEAVLNESTWELRFEVPAVKKGQKIYLNPEYDDLRLSTGEDKHGKYKVSNKDFPGEVFTKVIQAKDLLELIAKTMFESAEPGIQNIDIARKYSNSDVVGFPIIGTNACKHIAALRNNP